MGLVIEGLIPTIIGYNYTIRFYYREYNFVLQEVLDQLHQPDTSRISFLCYYLIRGSQMPIAERF